MMMATVEEEEEEAKAQQTQVAVDRLAPVNLVLHTPVQKRSYKEWSAWKKKVPSSLRPSLNPENGKFLPSEALCATPCSLPVMWDPRPSSTPLVRMPNRPGAGIFETEALPGK
jgi:hypothetical protein